MPPLVDIHCHPLPDLDDGAASWDEALAMARLAVDDGITCIVATTHQLGAFGHVHGDMIRNQAAQFQQRLDRQGVKLKILPGAEIRIEPDLVPRVEAGRTALAGRSPPACPSGTAARRLLSDRAGARRAQGGRHDRHPGPSRAKPGHPLQAGDPGRTGPRRLPAASYGRKPLGASDPTCSNLPRG